jgi:hypothetical protein
MTSAQFQNTLRWDGTASVYSCHSHSPVQIGSVMQNLKKISFLYFQVGATREGHLVHAEFARFFKRQTVFACASRSHTHSHASHSVALTRSYFPHTHTHTHTHTRTHSLFPLSHTHCLPSLSHANLPIFYLHSPFHSLTLPLSIPHTSTSTAHTLHTHTLSPSTGNNI